ncbi:BamA/TamA family outer membrane protein [Thermophagus sp. OGC60D27]|uniref:BamA/TamA family outer membrane protein n=1 Tax=Thermophagus sp. OGC60D27 TaxID=3458415 RepID=UPI004037A7D0
MDEKSYEDSTTLGTVAGLGEMVLDWVTWEKSNLVFTVYPSLSASSRNGFVYGLAPTFKWSSSLLPGKANTVTVNIETSTKGIFQLQMEHDWYFEERWMTSGEAYFTGRQDRFWMRDGNDPLYFDRKEWCLNWELLYKLTPSLWVGAGASFTHNRFSNLIVPDFSIYDFYGSEGGQVIGFGPKAVLDTRERTISPQTGSWIQLAPSFIGVAGFGDYQYFRATVDARHYRQVKRDKTTLAFQALFDYAGNHVPFYELPQLGGKERLRGIGHPLRETGNAIWLMRAELRQHLWWRVGTVLFAGIGEAAQNFQKPLENTLSSVGAGLRFRMLPDDPLNVRLDFGISSLGTTGFFVSLKEAF